MRLADERRAESSRAISILDQLRGTGTSHGPASLELSSQELVRRILETARETLGFQSAHISEIRDGKQIVRVVTGDASAFGLGPGTSIELPETYCIRMLDGRIPPVIGDAQTDERVRQLEVTREAGIAAYVGVPIRYDDGTLYGTLCVLDQRPAHVTEVQLDVVTLLGRVIGEILEHNEAVRKQNWLRGLVERLPLVVYEALPGLDGEWLYVSPQVEALLGVSVDEVLSEPNWWAARIHPDDRGDLGLAEEQATMQPGLKFSREYRMVTADGVIKWVLDEAQFEEASDGTLRMRGFLLDVTEQKEQELQIRGHANFMSALLDGMPQAVIACDAKGTITLMNRAAARLMHDVDTPDPVPPEEWATRYSLFARHSDAPLEPGDVPLLRALRGEHIDNATLTVRLPHERDVHLIASGRPIVDEDGTIQGAVVVMQDVTDVVEKQDEVRRLEGELQQGQKMEALGRVAGTIAHDFNNILGAVVGYAEMLIPDLNDPEHRQDVEHIANAGYKGSEIVRQLMDFARQEPDTPPRPVELGPLLANAENLLRPIIGEIHLSIQCSEDLVVIADEVQLLQVLMNLATNAAQACEEGGTVRIAAQGIELTEVLETRTASLVPGRYVRVDVRDTGPGIKPAVMECLFDPFFTTKPMGFGTGLGLATVFSAMKRFGGGLTVKSQVGAGATFSLYFADGRSI